MRLIQVTVGTTAAPLVNPGVAPAASLPFSLLVFQNNTTSTVRIGDNSVSSTKGIFLAANGLPFVLDPSLQYTSDFYEFWGVASASMLLDIMLFD
jgi:hypothetical protein